MITVGSTMTPVTSYPKILETESVAKALENLKEFSVNPWVGNKSIVVVNAEGEAVGLLTMKSLLKAIDLDDPAMEMELQGEYWSDYFAWHQKKWADVPVSKVMRPLNKKGIDADTPLLAAAKEFMKEGVNTMPVMQDGKVVGLVNVYHFCRFFSNHV